MKKETTKTALIQVRATEELKNEAIKYAEAHGIRLSDVVRIALENYLATR